jgi:hypothetical protein
MMTTTGTIRLLLLSIFSTGCMYTASHAGVTNTSSQGEWRSLFDGTNTSAWRGYKSQDFPAGWKIVDGALTKSGNVPDILTRDRFGDFELEFEWKIGQGGNSGFFIRGTEEYDQIYWSAPEYQLLDDVGHPDGKNRITAAGSVFALYPVAAGIVKPAGEWNSSRIVARGPHVEHWLNGRKVAEYEQWSADWDAHVAASKFKSFPNFGKSKEGYIGIQGDHPGDLSLRNIRIRPVH